MPALNQLDFEQEEPLASDEQFLGEELSRDPAEEKWTSGWGVLIRRNVDPGRAPVQPPRGPRVSRGGPYGRSLKPSGMGDS